MTGSILSNEIKDRQAMLNLLSELPRSNLVAQLLVISERVAKERPVKIKAAAEMLGVDQKTIREWLKIGILRETAGRAPMPKALDPLRLNEVNKVVQSLRELGQKRGLTNALWAALQDQAVLDNPDVVKGLEQLEQGQRRRWKKREDGSWGPAAPTDTKR